MPSDSNEYHNLIISPSTVPCTGPLLPSFSKLSKFNFPVIVFSVCTSQATSVSLPVIFQKHPLISVKEYAFSMAFCSFSFWASLLGSSVELLLQEKNRMDEKRIIDLMVFNIIGLIICQFRYIHNLF